MKCPYCGYRTDKVVDSREAEDGTVIRRRRECMGCGKRFTTYEHIENVPLFVVKRDGRRELFDRNKILNGIIKACEKRPVSVEEIESLVDRIEQEIRSETDGEVSSQEIGEKVMRYLSKLDDVAYVRFASVYRQFKDVKEFMEELQQLISQSQRKRGGKR